MITKIKKLLLGFMMPVLAVSAAIAPPASAAACDTGSLTFFPRWYDGLCDGKGNIKSPQQMSGGSGDAAGQTANKLGAWVTIIALNIVAMLLYAVGYVSLGFIIYGGFKYMTSGDNSSGTAAARKTILNAVIGLILSIMAVAIVNFVAGAVGGGGSGSTTTPPAATGGTP
jgi:hypothetical protein